MQEVKYQSSAMPTLSRPCFGAFLRPKFHRDSITDRLPLRHIFMRTPPTNHLKRVDFSVNASLHNAKNRVCKPAPRSGWELGNLFARMLLDSLPVLMISCNLGRARGRFSQRETTSRQLKPPRLSVARIRR